MFGVWGKYMHEHVAIHFSVVAHQTEEFHLHAECPIRRKAKGDVQP